MDDHSSNSDDDLFESAEESLDETDEKNTNKKSEKKKRLPQNAEVKKPVVRDNEKSGSDISEKDKSSKQNLVAYRKRPDKSKNSARKPATKTVSSSKNSKNGTIFKTDAIAPDNLLQDITTNLSKNINKSLNTIQQTSSNVKDLLLSSLPVTSAHETNVFSYDDANTMSTNTDETASSANSLSSSGHTDTTRTVPLENTDKSGNNKKVSGDPEMHKNIMETGLFKFLKGDSNNESAKTKLFTGEKNMSNTPDFSQYFNILQDSGQENNDSEEPHSKPQQKEVRSDKKLIASNEFNKINEEDDKKNKKPPISDCVKEKNNTLKTTSSLPGKKIKNNSISHFQPPPPPPPPPPPTMLSNQCKSRQKSPAHSKSKDVQSQDIQTKEKFKVGDGMHDVNTNIHKIHSELRKNLTEDKTLTKNKIERQLEELDDENDNNLVSLESCYAICEQLRHTGELDGSNISDKTYNLDENVIDWKDPITGWIKRTSESIDSVQKKKELNQNDKKQCESGKNPHQVPDDSKLQCKDTKSDVKDSTDQISIDVTFISKKECRNDPDGWDDFDFSDNEDLEVSPSSDTISQVKPVSRPEESRLKNVDEGSMVDNDKNKLIHREAKSNEKTSETTPQRVEKSKDSNKTELKEESWDWDNWGDEEDTKNDKEETIKDKTKGFEKSLDGEMWSGWDTFGQKQENKQKQSNWGSWGVNMLLDKASAVTQGISNALETSLGVPDAQTLARMDHAEMKKQKESRPLELMPGGMSTSHLDFDMNLFSSFGITDLVAGVTSKIVDHSKFQEIGSKVISGGLDTLETFGKKTMEVLQEGDPGLRSKRALFLGQNKPVLSQVLKEIRDKTEKELKEVEKKEMEKKCHFESTFDDYQGLVHLEALEMLSKQCELKLEQIRNSMNAEEQEDLDGVLEEVQQLCSLDDYDISLVSNSGDFIKSLTKAIEPLKDEISIQKIYEVQKDIDQWLQSSSAKDLSLVLVQQKLVSTLAQLTAAIVHQFHKVGELLSVKECRKTVEEIDALSEMTHILMREINKISSNFIKLSKEAFKRTESLAPLIDKIDLITNNATTYIKQAFNLLIPVLQVGAAV